MLEKRLHKWEVVILVTVPLIGVVTAIGLLWNRYVFPKDLALFGLFYAMTAVGITIGYHRMLTHRGFEAPAWLRGLFLIFGSMAFEGPPDKWAATHIKHHAHSDEEGDPHSPLDGFWHAHFGWLFAYDNFVDPKEHAPHLLQDKVAVWVSQYVLVWMTLSLLLPFLLGGWTGFVWGGLVRVFCVTHVTWSVNSICHVFGRRAFITTDASRNHWLVGLLAFGEGWHNNHHAFPSNAFHGMRPWQFDLSGHLIRLLERVGLVWDVQRVTDEMVAARLAVGHKMKHSFAQLREQLLTNITHAKESLDQFFSKTIVTLPAALQRSHLDTSLLRQAHHEALVRLEQIQKQVGRVRLMKQQKMIAYQAEVGHLVERTKERIREECARLAPLIAPANTD